MHAISLINKMVSWLEQCVQINTFAAGMISA